MEQWLRREGMRKRESEGRQKGGGVEREVEYCLSLGLLSYSLRTSFSSEKAPWT